MKKIEIQSFSDLHDVVTKYQSNTIFRGLSKHNYDLQPSIGRRSIETKDINHLEKKMMNVFKTHAVAHLSSKPENEWEWLALAQHYGLPTRLLDWTRNPLVALFFAAKSYNLNGAIYVLKDVKEVVDTSNQDPYKQNDIVVYYPTHITPRITGQSGLFTSHPKPEEKYESDQIEKIIIPYKKKSQLLTELRKYGVHRASLFPGLDGLCEDIKWIHDFKL